MQGHSNDEETTLNDPQQNPSESSSNDNYHELKEGKAVLRLEKKDGIFYNPVQEFNRDVSILIITVFFEKYKTQLINQRNKQLKIENSFLKKLSKKTQQNLDKTEESQPKIIKFQNLIPQLSSRELGDFVILEALAATGLRSIRYAHEIKNTKYIISNDILPSAVQTIAYNAKLSNVDDKIICTQMDAT